MTLYFLSLAFLVGLLFGSFLNVCIYRIPRDLSIVAPRSFCPECGHQLSWPLNLPLASFLFLRGRCRFCAQPISLRYPIVELVTGALFLLIAKRYALTPEALRWMAFDSLLIVLFFTDLEERLLPDELTLGGLLLGLVFAVLMPRPGGLAQLVLPATSAPPWQSLFNAALAAGALALPIWLIGALYGRIRNRTALGLGDVKLLAMLGAFLGLRDGLAALTIASVTGAVTGLSLLLFTKREAASYELPFGSFLCAAAILLSLFPDPARILLAVP